MRTVAIALVAALAAPAAASAAGSEPTPSTPSPTPPTQSAPAPGSSATTRSATTPAPASSAPKQEHNSSVAVWLLAILSTLVVLSAVFAGLAWWFGWSAERLLGRGRASWSSFEEFGDWIRSGY